MSRESDRTILAVSADVVLRSQNALLYCPCAMYYCSKHFSHDDTILLFESNEIHRDMSAITYILPALPSSINDNTA